MRRQHFKVCSNKFLTNTLTSLLWCTLKNEQEHIVHMSKILKILCKHRLYTNLYTNFIMQKTSSIIWVMLWAKMELKMIQLKLKNVLK